MAGLPNFNFPAFSDAAKVWRFRGYEVFSPAERDIEKHGEKVADSFYGNLADIKDTGFNLREAMEDDLVWICRHATAIYMLKGWENSRGARTEHALAVCLNLEIFYQD